MSEHEKAIKARRDAADEVFRLEAVSGEGSEAAIKRATTVTSEEFDRAWRALAIEAECIGVWVPRVVLFAAFAAAGFEVEP